ncbi:MAG: BON domain-containing protein [Candidatus Tectomicrobia bacterium]|nr:BON domain-containing protein [Candidatus Tectomicrobia bacterium]
MMSADDIKHAVLRELAWDTRVEVAEVGVEVDESIVTLSGTVSSYGKKLAAQEAAHRVASVHDVVNAIEVQALGAKARSDVDLAQMVRHILEWDVLVPDEGITSTVDNGWVTLEGTVEVWAQRDEAERAVQHLAGVQGVTNQITVAAPPLDSQDMRLAIQDALWRRATREANHIEVKVEGGQVTLSGRVQSPQEKRAILGTISHAPGVSAINDQLRIEQAT